MATTFSSGLRALRTPAFSLCRPRFSACSLRRVLSTSVPRLAPLAQAAAVPNAVTKRAPALEEPVDEPIPFSSLTGKVSSKTLEAITVQPFRHTHMTPVQEAVLSMLPELATPLKEGEDGAAEDSATPRDLMVRAKTGTGKTLAFLVPAIESRVKAIAEAGKLAAARAGSASDRRLEETAKRTFANTHVGALILSPTRELAKQIAREAERLSTHHGFKVHELLGGESKSQQIRNWRYGQKDIVVATTGRLRDLLNSVPEIKTGIQTAKLVILDEADTMLDMGFHEDIDAILQDLPSAPERQTFVFSATISKAIQQIARRTLSKNHVYINTVSEDDSPVHAHIPQYHTILPTAGDQLPHTLRLLAHDQLTNPGKSKAIIFLPTTKLTQLYSTLVRELSRAVLPAGRDTMVYEIHSKRNMDSRTKTSDRFRKDTSGACVLITSDVSARGVDYPGVTRVIQLGIPSSADQYVHRVGRTGRTGGTNGRGDLVLLPWEHGFVQGQLHHVPLLPVTTSDLAEQVSERAVRHDEDPNTFFPARAAVPAARPDFDRRRGGSRDRDRERERPPITRYHGRVAPRLEGLTDEIQEVLSSAVEPDEIRETFSSMLGYYVAKSTELRTTRNAILEGLRDWAVQAGGLPEPPYVSDAFLAKIGFSNDRKQRSMSFGQSRERTDSGRMGNRWDGRGSREARERRGSSGSGSGSGSGTWEKRERNEWPPRRQQTEYGSSGSERRSEDGSGERSGGGFRERRSWGGERQRGSRDGESRGRRSKSWSSEGEA